MSGYVGVGGAWKEMAPGCAVGVGGVWKSIDKIYVGVGGVWKEWYTNAVYLLNSTQYTETKATSTGVPVTDTVTVRVDADGNVYRTMTDAGTALQYAWVTPTSVAGTQSHWVRWTSTIGSLSSGTEATWEELSVDRSYSKSYNGLTGGDSVTGTLEIATDSGGSTVVATASVELAPTVQEF